MLAVLQSARLSLCLLTGAEPWWRAFPGNELRGLEDSGLTFEGWGAGGDPSVNEECGGASSDQIQAWGPFILLRHLWAPLPTLPTMPLPAHCSQGAASMLGRCPWAMGGPRAGPGGSSHSWPRQGSAHIWTGTQCKGSALLGFLWEEEVGLNSRCWLL